MPAAVRHVVLPHGGGDVEKHASKDPWHQFEGLVFVLISIHVAALGFWCWLLWKSRATKRAADGAGSGAKASKAAAAAAQSDWRSPRDILRAYQKTSLGKA